MIYQSFSLFSTTNVSSLRLLIVDLWLKNRFMCGNYLKDDVQAHNLLNGVFFPTSDTTNTLIPLRYNRWRRSAIVWSYYAKDNFNLNNWKLYDCNERKRVTVSCFLSIYQKFSSVYSLFILVWYSHLICEGNFIWFDS